MYLYTTTSGLAAQDRAQRPAASGTGLDVLDHLPISHIGVLGVPCLYVRWQYLLMWREDGYRLYDCCHRRTPPFAANPLFRMNGPSDKPELSESFSACAPAVTYASGLCLEACSSTHRRI